MEFELLGWPEDGPTLSLPHERFSYAGKFVMSNTGKAVVRAADDAILAAASFDDDRTDPTVLRIRYLTVRSDRRGERIGPRLAAFVVDRARERGYERVKIAVNNPFAYQALYRAGFAYTGSRTGIAELVLEHPGDRSSERYRLGFDAFREREDLSDAERSFLADNRDGDLPESLDF